MALGDLLSPDDAAILRMVGHILLGILCQLLYAWLYLYCEDTWVGICYHSVTYSGSLLLSETTPQYYSFISAGPASEWQDSWSVYK
jgi:hypothetical protein